MKKAAIRDFWNKLIRVPDSAKGISRIQQNISDTSQVAIDMQGVFCIVGANGAGKSSFFQFLTNPDYNQIKFSPHEIHLFDGTIVSVPGETIQATIIEPFKQLSQISDTILKFASTFGQGGALELPKDELSLVNYVLGSSYDCIEIEEVEVADGEMLPHFICKKDTQEYTHFSLSLGEQLVIFLYWILAKKNSQRGIFFLEEPETGLSPAAQNRIVDLLVYLSARYSKQIIISTHSPFIVSALGVERTIIMKRPSGSEWQGAKNNTYLDELGITPSKKGIFFLEDNKAKIFFEKILDIYGSSLRKSYDKVFLGGESNVHQVVSRASAQSRDLKIYGIIDADQKGVEKYSQPHFHFLPGNEPPELEVLTAVRADINEYARRLGVMPDRLSDALRRCQGYESHDSFEEISRELYGEVKPIVYESAFGVWYKNYPDKGEIERFIQSIDSDMTDEDLISVREFWA